MTDQPDGKRTRRPYNKPEWEQVQLIAEEAVLTNCKTVGGANGPTGGATGSPCQQRGQVDYCQVQGS
jgi:hypothetical protein